MSDLRWRIAEALDQRLGCDPGQPCDQALDLADAVVELVVEHIDRLRRIGVIPPEPPVVWHHATFYDPHTPDPDPAAVVRTGAYKDSCSTTCRRCGATLVCADPALLTGGATHLPGGPT